jgi:hypothetical protein
MGLNGFLSLFVTVLNGPGSLVRPCFFARAGYLIVKTALPNASSRQAGFADGHAIASNSNTLHIPYRRREEKLKKVPLRGNIRPSRNLWPKNVFPVFPTALCAPLPRPRRLSFHAAMSVLLTYFVNFSGCSRHM